MKCFFNLLEKANKIKDKELAMIVAREMGNFIAIREEIVSAHNKKWESYMMEALIAFSTRIDNDWTVDSSTELAERSIIAYLQECNKYSCENAIHLEYAHDLLIGYVTETKLY